MENSYTSRWAVFLTNAWVKALEMLGDVVSTRRNPNFERRVNEKASVTLAHALDSYIRNRGHRLIPTPEKQYRAILQNYSDDWMKQSPR